MQVAEECRPPGARWQQRQRDDYSLSQEIISEDEEDILPPGGVSPAWRHTCRASDKVEDRGAAGGDTSSEEEGSQVDLMAAVTERDATHGGGGIAPVKFQGEFRTIPDTADVIAVVSGGKDPTARNDGRGLFLEANRSQQPSPVAEVPGLSSGCTGQTIGPDPKGKAIVQWVVKTSDTVQTSKQHMQRCNSAEVEELVAEKHKNGDERDFGKRISSVIRDSFHQNGNGKGTANVEDEGEMNEADLSNFKLNKPLARDKEDIGLMDLGCAINTPSKAVSPLKKCPTSSQSPLSTSWLVYSRKRGIKSRKAHKAGVTPEPASLNPMHHGTDQNLQIQDSSGPADQQTQSEQSPSLKESENHNQTQNQDLHAENIWNTITELGLTTGPSHRNFVQQLIDMEDRDVEEAARMGVTTQTP